MSSKPLFNEPKAHKSPGRASDWPCESHSQKPSREASRVFSGPVSGFKAAPLGLPEDPLIQTLFLGHHTSVRNENGSLPELPGEAKDKPQMGIPLPSLIPVKRVVASNPNDQLGGGDPREKKLLRRRLNSEDEKSLISFTKMRQIFGGRDRPERKQSLNEGFQIPRQLRPEPQSQAIFDLTSVKRKTSVRKKSEDLGLRVRARHLGDMLELRNKSENSLRQKTPEVRMVASIRDDRAPKAARFAEQRDFNEPARGRRRTCKESEHAQDLEQENTKGSSFNTDKDNKNKQWINNLFDNSEHEINSKGNLQQKQEGSVRDLGFPKKSGKHLEFAKRELAASDAHRVSSRRKSSFVSLRRESIALEKSEHENLLEAGALDSHLGSAYRAQHLHCNIGSQISEEQEVDLDMEIERINVWTCRGGDGDASDLQWNIQVLDIFENPRSNLRSRKQSEALRPADLKSRPFHANKIDTICYIIWRV